MNNLNHVAFIMDGNGRWGKKNRKSRNFGHIKGVEIVKNIVKSSIKYKIPIVTFYVFSSENWKRPKKEVNFLLKLIKTYFSKEIDNIRKQGIKINILGDINKLSLEKNVILLGQLFNIENIMPAFDLLISLVIIFSSLFVTPSMNFYLRSISLLPHLLILTFQRFL